MSNCCNTTCCAFELWTTLDLSAGAAWYLLAVSWSGDMGRCCPFK
jgi:hypothetical protein